MLRSPHLARTITRLRTAAASLSALALLGAAACGGDTATGPSIASGSYRLTGLAVGGVCCTTLPVSYSYGGSTYEVSSGTLTFSSSNAATFNLQVSGKQNGTAATLRGDAGTYSQNGGTITFTPSASGATPFTGTISDNDQIKIPVTLQGYSTTLRFER